VDIKSLRNRRYNEIKDKQASIAKNNAEFPLIDKMSYNDSKKYIKVFDSKTTIENKWENIWNKQSIKLN